MSGTLRVLWDESLIQYDFGPGHPMDPVRIALTFSLARRLGVLSAPSVTMADAGARHGRRAGAGP